MAGDLIPILSRFHREVVLPDMKRIVGDAVEASERWLRDEVQTGFDVLSRRLEKLEVEFPALLSGIKRVEERLDALEDLMRSVERRLDSIDKKLEKLALKSELADLKARVDGLHSRSGFSKSGSARSSFARFIRYSPAVVGRADDDRLGCLSGPPADCSALA